MNVTVDNSDASIIYAPPGAWTDETVDTTTDYLDSHMLTTDPDATATFDFTGIAIYFISALWPYPVSTFITLDSNPITLINLTDPNAPPANGGPATAEFQVVWGMTGLANTQHTLVMSLGAGQTYAVVNALIYTVETDVTSSLSSSTSSGSTASGSFSSVSTSSIISSTSALPGPGTFLPNGNSNLATSETSVAVISIISSSTSALPGPGTSLPTGNSNFATSKTSVAVIAIGSSFGILGLVVISLALWYLFRLRRRKSPTSTALTNVGDGSGPDNPSTMSAVRPLNVMNNNSGNWSGNLVDDRSYMAQFNDGRNLRYGNVGIPAFPNPSHSYPHGGSQNGIGSGAAVNRRKPVKDLAGSY